jgi:hypothetical protein
MHTIGSADRYVVARENNVVIVDFRKPDPPAPHFPGAGALRVLKGTETEFHGCLGSDSQLARRLA